MKETKEWTGMIDGTEPVSVNLMFHGAKRVRDQAFAPFSNFKVGASIALADGIHYSGCNVENASYGMTICAERTAVVKAISNEHRTKAVAIRKVLVITDSGPDNDPAFPCGGCRSVLAQFSTADTEVYASNLEGTKIIRSTMGELLPHSFEMSFTSSLAKR